MIFAFLYSLLFSVAVPAFAAPEKGPGKHQATYFQFNMTQQSMAQICQDTGIENTVEAILTYFAKENNKTRICAEVSMRLEKGLENNTLHYQGWIKIVGRKTLNGLLACPCWLWGCIKAAGHAGYSHEKHDGYLDKISTGEGPKMRMKEMKEPPPPKKGWQALFMTAKEEKGQLYSWQQELQEEVKQDIETPRTPEAWAASWRLRRGLSLIVDTAGNTGKSLFQKFMCYKFKFTYQVPSLGSGKDMNQWICSELGQTAAKYLPKAAFCNFSRAFTGSAGKQLVMGFFDGAEALKDGEVIDTRYKATRLTLEYPPSIYIFCNAVPKHLKDAMSGDRWNIRWIIPHPEKDHGEDYVLVDVDPAELAPPDVDNDDNAGGDVVNDDVHGQDLRAEDAAALGRNVRARHR